MKALYDDAIKEYQEAIRIEPKFPDAYANIAHAYWFKGEFQLAVEWNTKALELRPDFPEARYNLGLIMKVSGRKEEALKQFEGALKAAPNFKEAKDRIAELQSEGQTVTESKP